MLPRCWETGPHNLPPLLTRQMYDEAHSFASSREHEWQRDQELKYLKNSLYMFSEFFLRPVFECEFQDMPGSYSE